jgi:hypothetical protein
MADDIDFLNTPDYFYDTPVSLDQYIETPPAQGEIVPTPESGTSDVAYLEEPAQPAASESTAVMDERFNNLEGPAPARRSPLAGTNQEIPIGNYTGVVLPNNAFVSRSGSSGQLINFDIGSTSAIDPSRPMTIATVGTDRVLVNTEGPGTVSQDSSGNLIFNQVQQRQSSGLGAMLTSPQFAAPVGASLITATAGILMSLRQDRANRQIAREQLQASLEVSRQGAEEQRQIAEDVETNRRERNRIIGEALRRGSRRSK